MSWKDHLWANFAELLLCCLLLFFAFSHHLIVDRVPSDPDAIRWIEGLIGQILAALITLIIKQPSKGGTA
jgi:hypothetical protein